MYYEGVYLKYIGIWSTNNMFTNQIKSTRKKSGGKLPKQN